MFLKNQNFTVYTQRKFEFRASHWRWNRTLVLLVTLCSIVLAGCSPAGEQSAAGERVNGFGTALNHTHSLIAFPDNLLIMASHFGLFRSTDGGKNWKTVAGGPGQLMDGLMTESMVYNSDNPQRMYVLASEPSIGNAKDFKGTMGLYTSADQGQNWELKVKADDMGRIRFVRPGNSNPDEVFIYVQKLGKLGLKVSQDAGAHFTSAGTLPFENLYSMLAVPGKPGEILICGENGIARSTDSGLSWEVISTIKSTVFEITTAGPGMPIYAAGDDGIYASQDGGKTFELVHSDRRLASLAVTPAEPKVVYGKTGTSIFRSEDGGQSWQPLPSIQGNLANLAVDPEDTSMLYLSLSYPTAIQRYDGKQWASLTPEA